VQPSNDLSARFARDTTVNNHEQTDRKKKEENNDRPRPNRGLFFSNVVKATRWWIK